MKKKNNYKLYKSKETQRTKSDRQNLRKSKANWTNY